MPAYHVTSGGPVWFDLTSTDPARAAQFYGTLFGWTVTDPDPEFGGYQNFSANGNLVAGLLPKMDPQAPGDVWTVYFKTDDADAAVAAATDAGGTVIAPPMPVGDLGTMAVLADTAGAVYGLWQAGTHPGFVERGTHGTPYWFDTMSMDYAASTAYYEKALGWVLTEIGSGGDPDSVGPDHYSEVRLRGGDPNETVAGIMGAAGMFGADHPSFWQVYITVDDVDAAVAKTAELGGEVVMPGEVTPWGTLATIKDPMGAVICLAHPPAGM